MGFFHPEPEIKARPERQARKTKEPIDIATYPRGCDHCSLRQNWNFIASPRMAPSGNIKDPDILVLGEFPNEDEDRAGKPFAGPAMDLIRKAIPGRDQTRVMYQNLVRCHTRNNTPASVIDAHSCSIHIEADLMPLSIKAILGIGTAPLAHFYPGAQLSRIHGTRLPVCIGGRYLWYWPVLGPEYIHRTGDDRSAAFGTRMAMLWTL